MNFASSNCYFLHPTFLLTIAVDAIITADAVTIVTITICIVLKLDVVIFAIPSSLTSILSFVL